jgi:hypothetical protein
MRRNTYLEEYSQRPGSSGFWSRFTSVENALLTEFAGAGHPYFDREFSYGTNPCCIAKNWVRRRVQSPNLSLRVLDVVVGRLCR